MECPVCKQSHSNRFEAILIEDIQLFICCKCGVVFRPITYEGKLLWKKLVVEKVMSKGRR